MSYDKTNSLLKKYDETKGTKDEKYNNIYRKTIKDGKTETARTIRRALVLLENCNDRKVKQIARTIREKRMLVIFDDSVGWNEQGCLYRYGEWEKKSGWLLKDGVILVNKAYTGNAIGTAGVLAHEIRHLLDIEETRAKRLDVGIIISKTESLNEAEPQSRADITGGYVLNALGYKANLSSEEKNKMRSIWGNYWDKNNVNLNFMDHKVTKYNEFEKEKHKMKAEFCCRPCRTKQGPCGRKIYFPPCWDH
jgi:hypothetical protein